MLTNFLFTEKARQITKRRISENETKTNIAYDGGNNDNVANQYNAFGGKCGGAYAQGM